MKKTWNFVAAMTLLTTLAAPSLFAEPRPREQTQHEDWRVRSLRVISVEGRIRDIDRERNGFVIRLDRGRQTLFVPRNAAVRASHAGNRSSVRALEEGDFIRATATLDSQGRLYVTAIDLLREEDDRADRDDRRLSGVVESVDRFRATLRIRDDRSGRSIVVDAREAGSLDGLRRGDRVRLRGDWRRDGRFEAERIQLDRDRW
jgi:hypothetical protein